MNASDRINNIVAIASSFSKESWGVIDLTLGQFDFNTEQTWNGDKDDYVITMLSNSREEGILDLAKHLNIISQLEADKEPFFWATSDCRVFLSHLTGSKNV